MFKIIQDCRHQIAQEILKNVVPAGKGSKWKKHNTNVGDVMNASQRTRLFDVVSSGESFDTNAWGTSTDDHYVKILIVIGYSTQQDFNECAQSDFDAIKYRLHNIDVSAVTGLNFYKVEGYQWKESEDFRYMIIPVATLITASQT